MKKFGALGLAFVVLMVLGVLPVMSAPPAPADGHEMKRTGKGPVLFNHSTHTDYECADCHHKWDGKSETIQSCADSGCHDKMGPKEKDVHSYYKAMHEKKTKDVESCISCHRKVLKAKGKDKKLKKQLTACNGSGCHPKK